MLNRPSIVALTTLFSALLLPGIAAAQQPVPDAPQPQKKTASKPPPPDTPAPAQPPKDDNAFPEAVSKAAAEAATEDKEPDPAAPQASATPKTPTAQDNPFPEDVSKAAAKAAGNQTKEPAPVKPDLPPGVSSSQATSADDAAAAAEVPQDPARAKNDAQVGTYYLQTGDYKGALLRFQEASASDPTNVDAIFGLAETHRLMGRKVEAARDYETYLAIVPHGGKSKEAAKQLKALQAK